MKRLFLFVLFFAFAVEAVGALRTSHNSVASAKDVIEQFVGMDAEGMRLLPKGWEMADALFTQRSEPPAQKSIIVIAAHYGVSATPNASEFDMGYEELGRIGASLLFVATKMGIETRYLITYRAISTAAGWRIEGKQPDEMRMTVIAANAYLRHIRDETTDSILKENAEKSLTTLASYR